METFKLNDNHQIVLCLLMLCKMTRYSDPLAYAQYRIHLKELENIMMKEFDHENV